MVAGDYASARQIRREHAYEALLGAGRARWRTGERVRVYRARGGRAALFSEDVGDEGHETTDDPRDYDVAYYERLLRDTYAARLVRAMTPDDFEHVFASLDQLALFTPNLREQGPILTVLGDASLLDAAQEASSVDDENEPR